MLIKEFGISNEDLSAFSVEEKVHDKYLDTSILFEFIDTNIRELIKNKKYNQTMEHLNELHGFILNLEESNEKYLCKALHYALSRHVFFKLEVKLTDPYQNTTETLRESRYGHPHNLFKVLLDSGDILVGRKDINPLWISNESDSFIKEGISENDILGYFKAEQIVDFGVEIQFYPVSSKKKTKLFNEIINNNMTEITFPFGPVNYDTKKESILDNDYWDYVAEYEPEKLDVGETAIRDYIKTKYSNTNEEGLVLFDPGCSSGTFLYELKQTFKTPYLIGHDLNPKMVKLSKTKLDEASVSNAEASVKLDKEVDILFLRFISYMNCSSNVAKEILTSSMSNLKKEGSAIMFGKTGCHLTKEKIEPLGLKVTQCSAYLKDQNSVTSFYEITK